MTTKQAYNDLLGQLFPLYESGEANNIATWVFENSTGLKRWEREAYPSRELTEEQLKNLEKYGRELAHHKPVQYVLQEAWFYKMKFFVNENVLIPRPETEELVRWVVEDLQSLKPGFEGRPARLLEVGTGSGCIAIAIKKEMPALEVEAIDLSGAALKVAGKNADLLKADVTFNQADFLNESGWDSPGMYDVLVSNPPYIPDAEKSKLPKNVSDFEPGMALFVRDTAPFIFYEKIAKFARDHLSKGGKIYVEIHEEYAGDVRQIFSGYHFQTVIRRDMYGKERMIRAKEILK